MFDDLSVVLGEVLAVRCSEADNSSSARVDNIDPDNHRILHSGCNLDSIEILSQLGVNLLEDVRVDSDLCSLDR